MLNSIVGVLGNGAVAAGDFQSIATAYGTGSSTSITFSSIPQTFTHLQIRWVIRSLNASFDTVYAYNFNNDTNSTGAAGHILSGNGSSISSTSYTGSFSTILGYAPATPQLTYSSAVGITDILDYTNTNKLKTIRSVSGWDGNGGGAGDTYFLSALPVTRPGTGAVTSLTILCNGNISTTSSVALYGIKG